MPYAAIFACGFGSFVAINFITALLSTPLTLLLSAPKSGKLVLTQEHDAQLRSQPD